MILLECLAACVEYLCGIRVLAAFFARRNNNRWFFWGAITLCGLIHMCLSMFTGNWQMLLRMLPIMANWFLVGMLCYCGNGWKKLLVLLLFWALAFSVDFSVLAVYTAVMNFSLKEIIASSADYVACVLCRSTLLLFASFGCGRLVGHQKRRLGGGGMAWLCLALVPLYTMVSVSFLFGSAQGNSTFPGGLAIFGGGLLAINACLYLVVNHLERNFQIEEEKRSLQAELAHNLQLVKTYQASFEQQRKLTHEFNNQLIALGDLLAQGEYTRASSYLRHLQQTTPQQAPAMHTNHPMVDALINQKSWQAAQQGVRMLIACNDLSGIPLEDGDLVTLLGNLLDNAIAASAQSASKQIWLRLWQEQEHCQLTLRNTCPEAPVARAASEQMYHGFGTGLVTAVLQKYGCPYCAERQGELYVFSAILG